MKNNIRHAALSVVMAVAFVAANGGAAAAHHSAAPFDMGNQKTVTGTVKQVEWTNPHTWIWLNVTNDQGLVETWGFEGMSPNYWARRGWTRTTLKPGDTISLVFRPLKDGSHGGMFVSTKLADGRVLTGAGASPTER